MTATGTWDPKLSLKSIRTAAKVWDAKFAMNGLS